MNRTSTSSIRRLAVAGMVGALATCAAGIVVQAIVQPASEVSDEMWSYPWTSEALAPVSLVYAGFHLLVFLGMVGFARSGYAGAGQAARVGAGFAICGTFMFFLAELATIPFRDQRLDDTGPMLVGGLFGCGLTLTAVGLVVAGVAALRSDQQRTWERFVPLTAGLWSAVLIGVSLTKSLPAGVAVYGLTLVLLNVVVYRHSPPSVPSKGAPIPQVRAQR